MNTSQFLVKSSSGDSYLVDFAVIGARVRVFCRCQAGKNKTLCKHVTALLARDHSILADATQSESLTAILESSEALETLAKLEEFSIKLQQIAGEKEGLVHREKALKKALAAEILR